MNEVEIPEWLTSLGLIVREASAAIAEVWSTLVVPVLSAAPNWAIGLAAACVIAWAVIKR